MADRSAKIRALHAAGVDPVEICCRLLVSWQTVEAAVNPAGIPETPSWVGIDLGRRTETGPPAATADPEPACEPDSGPIDPEPPAPNAPPPLVSAPAPPAGPALVTAAEIRRREERAAIERFLAEREPSRAVDFGEDAPAILFLKSCAFIVCGAPPPARAGRWLVNGVPHSRRDLWRRAREEAERRGQEPPRGGAREVAS
ncbi:MAG: hypothetical protein NXI21_01910 [Alphaproteobacteria bacterium]|nr:hypothetical protein [Alphaproteobacteria bacterium]